MPETVQFILTGKKKAAKLSTNPTSLSLICPPHLDSQRLRSWKGKVCSYEHGSAHCDRCLVHGLCWALNLRFLFPVLDHIAHRYLYTHEYSPLHLLSVPSPSSPHRTQNHVKMHSFLCFCPYKPLKERSMRVNSVSPASATFECLEQGLSLRITWLLNGCVETLKQPR